MCFQYVFFDYPPPNMLQQGFVYQYYDVFVDLVRIVYIYISLLVIAILSSGKLRDLASIPQVWYFKRFSALLQVGKRQIIMNLKHEVPCHFEHL